MFKGPAVLGWSVRPWPSSQIPQEITVSQIDFVSGGTIKFGGFGAAIQSEDPVFISLPTEIVDADGDTVAGGDIDITLTPPVVIDMDGDGVEFLDRTAGVVVRL